MRFKLQRLAIWSDQIEVNRPCTGKERWMDERERLDIKDPTVCLVACYMLVVHTDPEAECE